MRRIGLAVAAALLPLFALSPALSAAASNFVVSNSSLTVHLTDSGGPVAGINVYAYPVGASNPAAGGTTNGAGNVTLSKLSAGTEYDIFELDRAGFHLMQWYQGQPVPAQFPVPAGAAPVSPGPESGISDVLTKAGVVTGTVTNCDGAPLKGIGAYLRDGNGNDRNGAPTNGQGQYRIVFVPGGSYQAHFLDRSGTYSPTEFSGNPVTVTPGSTTAGVNQALGTTGPCNTTSLAVYAGYADVRTTNNAHPNNFPSPWLGSPGVTFIGSPGEAQLADPDESAIRLDNLTGADMPGVTVSVNYCAGSATFNPWGSFTVPAHAIVILSDIGNGGFDGSDTCTNGINTITVNRPGSVASYPDQGILHSVFPSANESTEWTLVGSS